MDIGKDGQVKMKAQGDGSSFENNTSARESDLGVPLYPGSKEITVASMKANTKDEAVTISTRTTIDDPDKVIAFYRPLLTVKKTISVETDGAKKFEISGTTTSGLDLGISVERSAHGTETTVVIASSKKK